ncbi:hypothetical protein NC796_01845 [Aliifodinibius sp. S!AR15-10]|uniref:hypothetical protein n=1 Tax=Aliifodinibius sp. S!AR15-10 TaxID=2950437 RepID=UPI002866AE2D|nr:hypothetical protein [Aliifodinibius sp. S!AR15-10]MDR8389861.1 hypothetical protein [Aliifodinibius sp. S!AR15-10]
MSNSTYVSCGCSQNPGLGEAVAGIPVARLRKWVQGLKQQEGGRVPTVSKLNGNMGWYKRTKGPGNEKYDLYAHFGWSASKVLDYLKQAVPEEFGLAAKKTVTATKTKVSPPTVKVADSAAPTQSEKAPAAPSIGGIGKSKLIIGGGVLAAGLALLVMTRN